MGLSRTPREPAYAVGFLAGLCASGCAMVGPVAVDAELPRLRTTEIAPARVVTFDASDPAEVPLIHTGHALLVRPTIDDEDAGWFVLDTGATVTTITSSTARRLGLPAVGRTLMQGNIDTAVFGARRLELGPLTLHEPRLMGMDLPLSGFTFGRTVNGFCGYDVFFAAVVEIDIDAGRLRLFDPGTYRLAEGVWHPLRVERHFPSVEAQFEGGHTGRFLLDTGFDSSVWFLEPVVVRHDLLASRQTRGGTLLNLGATNRVRRGSLAWIEVCGRRFEAVEAEFSLDPIPLNIDTTAYTGIIGIELLRSFEIILDYTHRRIALLGPKDIDT